MDRESSYINCLTGNHPSAGHIPLYYDSDREILENALQTIGLVEPAHAKVVRIRDTLDVEEVLVSDVYEPEVAKRDDLSVVEPAKDIAFDDAGDLTEF